MEADQRNPESLRSTALPAIDSGKRQSFLMREANKRRILGLDVVQLRPFDDLAVRGRENDGADTQVVDIGQGGFQLGFPKAR